jgi:hypothetical protein
MNTRPEDRTENKPEGTPAPVGSSAPPGTVLQPGGTLETNLSTSTNPSEPNPQAVKEKMFLLDFDAIYPDDGPIDFSKPAPTGLVSFLYEKSQEGAVLIWSKRLAEPNGPPLIWNWLLEAERSFRSSVFRMQMAPVTRPEGLEELTFKGSDDASTPNRSSTGRHPDVSGGTDTKVSGTEAKEGTARRSA